MALSNCTWEVRTGGSNANGGGFDTNSTFPTDGAATSATGASPVFSSASYNFVAGDVGHWVFIKSGTNWLPGWYKITAVSSNNATLNATAGQGVRYWANKGFIQGPTGLTGCATTGSPTGATWGIDYSQNNAAHISFTDMKIDATTNTRFTSAANPVGKNFIGNIINVTSGTGFTVQRVKVQSTSGTVATCDKSLGTLGSTGGNGAQGGALADPAFAVGASVTGGSVSGEGVYIQSGNYSITSATTNVAGGCISQSVVGRIEGYNLVRGDLVGAPVLTASGIATATLWSTGGVTTVMGRNITLDGASLTAIKGFDQSSAVLTVLEKITAKNCTNTGITCTSGFLFRCLATGCTTAGSGFNVSTASFTVACEAYDNTVPGFIGPTAGSCTFVNCIADSNTGATSDGFQVNGGSVVVYLNCTAYGNGRDGFRCNGTNVPFAVNCIAEGNGGYGFNNSGSSTFGTLSYCATYNNTSGATEVPAGVNNANWGNAYDSFITLGSSPFVDAANRNFALSPSSGLSLRGTGYPGLFPGGATTGYMDVGAAQAPYAAGTFGEQSHVFIQ